MFGFVLGLKGIAIASVVALAIGFAGGVKVRDAFCDAATAKRDLADARAKIEQRDRELKVVRDLADSSTKTVGELEKQKAAAEEKIRELERQIDAAEKGGKPDPNAVADASCRVTPAGVRWFATGGR